MQPSTRLAGAEDVPELVRLDLLARTHMGAHKGGETYLVTTVRPEPTGVSFLEDLGHPQRRVLLGCLGDSAVGYAVATTNELRDGRLIADIGELFVEPDARGVGVGESLMGELVRWATEAGCIGIDARALPGDRSTKNFFESFGLVARAITVHRDLRTP